MPTRRPKPVRFPVMLQTWRNLTFLHWRYEPDLVRSLLPDHVELDTFDGMAWVSLTPFLLDDLRPPGLPALPWISRTPETNVRTYVRGAAGEPGIWFFSLDIGRLPAALFGRAAYAVPYVWSDMTVQDDGGRVRYAGRRRWPRSDAGYEVVVQPGAVRPAAELSALDHFLTDRFVLYSSYGPVPGRAFVEHPPWSLAGATVVRLEENLLASAGLPGPVGEPLVHFSPGVAVRISRPHLA